MKSTMHAKGFPAWGPATLCGQEGAVHEVAGEIDCEQCLAIGESGETMTTRIVQLESEIGRPTEAFRLRLVRGGEA